MASIPYIIDQQAGRPESVQAETTILGAMLLDAGAIQDAIARLAVEDFSLDSHRRIYAAMLALLERSHAVDLITVGEELRKRKEIEAVGGPAYLASLTEGLPRNLSVENYVRIVKDKAQQRDLMALGDELLRETASGQFTASELAQRATMRLESISLDGDVRETQTVGQFIAENYADPESLFTDDRNALGISTGFEELDRMLNGLQPGEVYVFAGRPGSGKTALAGSLIDKICRAQNKKTALFTLENRKKSVLKRMLCGRARISLSQYNRRECSPVQKTYLRDALNEYKAAPLFWEDRNHLTMTEMRTISQRIQRLHGLDLILIDQLSHVDMSDVYERGVRPDILIGRQMTKAKRMAQDLNVPVIIFNQLGRGVAKSSDNRPTLADLKESGRIEEVADCVVFPHRPAYYAKTQIERDEMAGQEEFIVAKQRDGPTGICQVRYIEECCLWLDKATDRQQNYQTPIPY